jgi:3-polyprenyl-4-hydroxybenzoate decarboxylase
MDELIDHIVFRTLDQFGIRLPEAKRWYGIEKPIFVSASIFSKWIWLSGVSLVSSTSFFRSFRMTNKPVDMDELIDHIVFRTLDQFGIRLPEAKRWYGIVPLR